MHSDDVIANNQLKIAASSKIQENKTKDDDDEYIEIFTSADNNTKLAALRTLNPTAFRLDNPKSKKRSVFDAIHHVLMLISPMQKNPSVLCLEIRDFLFQVLKNNLTQSIVWEYRKQITSLLNVEMNWVQLHSNVKVLYDGLQDLVTIFELEIKNEQTQQQQQQQYENGILFVHLRSCIETISNRNSIEEEQDVVLGLLSVRVEQLLRTMKNQDVDVKPTNKEEELLERKQNEFVMRIVLRDLCLLFGYFIADLPRSNHRIHTDLLQICMEVLKTKDYVECYALASSLIRHLMSSQHHEGEPLSMDESQLDQLVTLLGEGGNQDDAASMVSINLIADFTLASAPSLQSYLLNRVEDLLLSPHVPAKANAVQLIRKLVELRRKHGARESRFDESLFRLMMKHFPVDELALRRAISAALFVYPAPFVLPQLVELLCHEDVRIRSLAGDCFAMLLSRPESHALHTPIEIHQTYWQLLLRKHEVELAFPELDRSILVFCTSVRVNNVAHFKAEIIPALLRATIDSMANPHESMLLSLVRKMSTTHAQYHEECVDAVFAFCLVTLAQTQQATHQKVGPYLLLRMLPPASFAAAPPELIERLLATFESSDTWPQVRRLCVEILAKAALHSASVWRAFCGVLHRQQLELTQGCLFGMCHAVSFRIAELKDQSAPPCPTVALDLVLALGARRGHEEKVFQACVDFLTLACFCNDWFQWRTKGEALAVGRVMVAEQEPGEEPEEFLDKLFPQPALLVGVLTTLLRSLAVQAQLHRFEGLCLPPLIEGFSQEACCFMMAHLSRRGIVFLCGDALDSTDALQTAFVFAFLGTRAWMWLKTSNVQGGGFLHVREVRTLFGLVLDALEEDALAFEAVKLVGVLLTMEGLEHLPDGTLGAVLAKLRGFANMHQNSNVRELASEILKRSVV